MRAEGDIGEISCSRTGVGSPRAAKVTAPEATSADAPRNRILLSITDASTVPVRNALDLPSGHDVEARHHGVVLVQDVMAVHDILAEEVAEIDQDSKLIVPPDVEGVLAAHPMRPGRLAVPRVEAKLVRVGGAVMAPAPRTV